MGNIVTNINELDFSKKYSYADYLKWQFEDRVELIKGWIHKMSPAPSRKHQKIEGVIFATIWNYFRDKNCEVYNSPFDVRLTKNKGQSDLETETVVQPDIVVVCDTSILDERGCNGSPDLVVEVLSQSTLKKDFNEKFNLYEENQIKEYWLVHPELQTVETYILKDNKYELNLRFENSNGIITSPQLADFSLDCKEIFKD